VSKEGNEKKEEKGKERDDIECPVVISSISLCESVRN